NSILHHLHQCIPEVSRHKENHQGQQDGTDLLQGKRHGTRSSLRGVTGLEESLKGLLFRSLVHVDEQLLILQPLEGVDGQIVTPIRVDDEGVRGVLILIGLFDCGTGADFRIAAAGEVRNCGHDHHRGVRPLLPAHDQAAVGSLAAVDQAVVEPLRILRIGGHQLVLPAVGHHAVKQAAHLLLAVRAFGLVNFRSLEEFSENSHDNPSLISQFYIDHFILSGQYMRYHTKRNRIAQLGNYQRTKKDRPSAVFFCVAQGA
ncbi:N-acyl homoserine lactonase, partial [Dysosmobacter welbionis]